MRKKSLFISAFILAATQAWGQQESFPAGGLMPARPLPQNEEPRRAIELSTGFQKLTNGFGDWHDVTVRGTYDLRENVLQGEASALRRFGTNGAFLGLGDTYTFNPDWYGSLSAGVGDGAFYLPRFRVDATLNRKLLEDRRLVGTLGLGYYRAPDGHTDRSVSVGAVYYFPAPWVVEGGIRFNTSNPGNVRTHQQFVAATWGRDKQDLVTARYMWGAEGYQAIAESTQLVNFRSREATLMWRHWLDPRSGVLVGATHYSNPSYRRTGINAGFFYKF